MCVLQNIAIVLSDGEANNQKDKLPAQCQKLHDDGIEVKSFSFNIKIISMV